MVDLSVIIVSYNTCQILADCLKSVFSQKGVKLEVLVVDNASTDGTVAMLETDFPQVKPIKNSKNYGFARANNQALAKASGKFLLLLNSDTVLGPGVLTTMLTWMKDRPQVGISTCQLITPQGPQSLGGFFPTPKRIFLWMSFIDDLPLLNHRAYHLPARYTADWSDPEGIQLDWVSGAFFLMRDQVFAEIGGLAEDFFMYVEEVEYCLRAKKKGWQVVYTPAARLTHLGGGSSTLGSQTAILGEYQSLIKLYELHFAPWRFWLRFWLKIGALFRILVFGYGRNNAPARKFYTQAFKTV